MMSAQMMSGASSGLGTVADLAPGAKDGMRMLEAKAAEMAGEMPPAVAISKGGIMFVRGETQGQPQGEDKSRVVNPDKIDIDDEDDDENGSNDEEDEEKGDDVPIMKKEIPSEVFGSLKPNAQKSDEDE